MGGGGGTHTHRAGWFCGPRSPASHLHVTAAALMGGDGLSPQRALRIPWSVNISGQGRLFYREPGARLAVGQARPFLVNSTQEAPGEGQVRPAGRAGICVLPGTQQPEERQEQRGDGGRKSREQGSRRGSGEPTMGTLQTWGRGKGLPCEGV